MILLAFTRQHYKALLDIFAKNREQPQYVLIEALADYLAKDNALFNRNKFFEYYNNKCEELDQEKQKCA